ncbi:MULTISPECIES: autotransporter assembly complex protein TamA [unclassified Ketobacter]|uniref:autotransporter assembly complex protein TamA n=1 Tax=unclassified Ketobacter TaxID=2639109 RepID=UPI000F2AFFCF|nr:MULTISPECIES: autotransporter assembly complex family protein [unclassified Ketobacter]MEC8812064.1 autotransporter assembly complex family protein [Pseudomonadota bacterium]RLT87544.1 MAG: outer membrane protein assembly factor [Ketobacter sp. GenoA1]RLT93315.1 MAG: outer membrane protein assembly factor [Ketobacter sp.]
MQRLPVWLLVGLLLMPCYVQAKLEINISGVGGKLRENVELHLSRYESLPRGDDDSIRRTLHNAVTKALQPYGYYEPSIQSEWTASSVQLNIDPGTPVVWRHIQITVPLPEHDLNDATMKLLRSPPFKAGQPINHSSYDNYKKDLLVRLRQQGFLDATWERSQLLINTEEQHADVLLHMSPGQRYRITEIRTQGSGLSDKTTMALVKIQEGEYYNADRIGLLYEDLLTTGYFKNAVIDVEKTPPDQATLNLQLEDQPKDQFTTGIGYGTNTGARGKLGWTRSRVNNRGDDIYSNLQVSQIGEEISLQYRIPWPHPLERYLSLETGWKREETTDRESSVFTTGIALKRSLRKQWQYSVGVNLENENYRQGDNPEESITYLLPNYHYMERLLFGERNNPTAILKYWLDASLGFNVLQEDTQFLSTAIGASYTWHITSLHTIATRFELGGIMTNNFYSVPLSKRFYTGGDQTVRGYKYNSLAPEDEDGDLLGGQFLNVFSVEYQYALNEEWSLATFADTGRTFISSHDPFHSGAGFGLRWHLPIGTFSFDIAKPITGEDKSSPRVHIYLGMLL